MRGKIETIPKEKSRRVHTLVYWGLAGMLATGALLFYPFQEYLLSLPAFWSKMTFLCILLINSIFVGKCMDIAAEHTFQSLTKKQKVLLVGSGVVSLISWLGILISARFLGL